MHSYTPGMPSAVHSPRGPRSTGAGITQSAMTLTSADGTRFAAFAAAPKARARIGVVVLPDVRGLQRFYEELTRRLAERGAAAVAIDYFGRTAGLAERPEGFAHMEHVRATETATIQADVAAAAAWLRSRAGGSRTRIFTLGFSFGGSHSWLAAAGGHELAGAIGFYGTPGQRKGEPGPIQLASQIAAPILALQAGDDDHIGETDNAALERALAKAGVEHEVVTYERTPHSFFDRRQNEHRTASDDAWARVAGFLRTRG